ncbi:MAG TPA: SRPBCC family protein [Bryobacteraceae bacterium]|nr:SRPBCC family protein [Bryobacteraceae bacterium]
MPEPSVIHNTFVLERSYPKPPERVFAAFSNPAVKRRWFGGSDSHEIAEFESDFRVGGAERLSFPLGNQTPFPGVLLTNEVRYQDIVPNQRIVTASTMDIGGKRVSSSLITFEFLPTDKGTDLICTHQGAFFEGSGGPKIREDGWRKLLDSLAAELER